LTNISNKKESLRKNYPQNLNLDNYNEILKNYKEDSHILYNSKKETLIKISNYPILISNKVDLNYYVDIFRYLYLSNNMLEISKYSENIQNIKNINSRDNKKIDFRKKVKNYFLDEDDILHKKILVSKNESIDNDKKSLTKEKKLIIYLKFQKN
jgi:hypothetical protein